MPANWPFRQDQTLTEPFGALEQALSSLPDESRYREILWEATLAHIASVPRYQKQRHTDLECFPLLTGQDIADAERLHDLYHPQVPREVIFSSGGSSGRAKLMPHCYAQFTAINMLEEARLDSLHRHDDYTPFDGRPFARLRLLETDHGPRFPWPNGRNVQHLALACDQGNNLPAIRDVITGSDRNPMRGRDTTELIAAMSKLIAVTSALERTGQDLSKSTVQRVFAGGSSSSPARQQWIEQIIGGRFVELFGSTEVFQGNCERCLTCRQYHEPLTVIHEYLPTDFPDPYRELVVTTLVPFALSMPLLRYRTGDLVLLGSPCPTAGKVGFEYIGRVTDCRYFPERGLVLSPLHIARSIPFLSGIHRFRIDKLEDEIPLPEHLGWPAYHCDMHSGERVRVQIELAGGPSFRSEKMRSDLLERLAEVDQRIPGYVQIEFLPLGTLQSYSWT